MSPSKTDITLLLNGASRGDAEALNRLLPLVYDELRELASRHMASERGDHTLQPTALAHEAYLRLVGQREVDWNSRAQFFSIAAQSMRRILVDHARRRGAIKAGGQMQRAPLEAAEVGGTDQRSAYLLAVHEALERFVAVDPQAARVVELRFFGGLSVEEAAQVVGRSPRSVKRDWQFARAWLAREIDGAG